jgi:hypothetical protein
MYQFQLKRYDDPWKYGNHCGMPTLPVVNDGAAGTIARVPSA